MYKYLYEKEKDWSSYYYVQPRHFAGVNVSFYGSDFHGMLSLIYSSLLLFNFWNNFFDTGNQQPKHKIFWSFWSLPALQYSHICFQTTHFQESEVICQLVLTFYRLSACLLLCLWSIFSKAFENVLELALKCQIAAAALTKLRKQSCFTHVMSEWHFHRSLKINDCTRWKIGEAILLQWLTKKKLIQFGKSRSSGILWLTVTSVLSIPAS